MAEGGAVRARVEPGCLGDLRADDDGVRMLSASLSALAVIKPGPITQNRQDPGSPVLKKSHPPRV